MTRMRAIGLALAVGGGLLLAACLVLIFFYPSLTGVGLTMAVTSRLGFAGISGFALLASGLRIMGNSGTN
ncbi:MAG: hypothetical protein J7498_03295 [Sphingobium sp.]|nr:hypothetical protein [Sphingobium sp.]